MTLSPEGQRAGDNPSTTVRVGVLALQGSFREHMSMLQKVPGVDVVEVRTREELASVSGLVIPGGESTTMALIAERWGLIPDLQAFARGGKPVWGTCAGMIFLAERASGVKKGGQTLVGGLDITVSRNFFGAQINSFETELPVPECFQRLGGPASFRALFIRAPAVMEVGAGVEVLASYTLTDEERAAQGRDSVVVAVRSGPLLATAFHPELTKDLRWHQLFAEMVQQSVQHKQEQQQQQQQQQQQDAGAGRPPNRPADLPTFGAQFMSVQ